MKVILFALVLYCFCLRNSEGNPARNSASAAEPKDAHPNVVGPLKKVINKLDRKTETKPRSDHEPDPPAQRKSPTRKRWRSLLHNEKCINDIANLCTKEQQLNNFLIIDCLERDDTMAEKVSNECQHTVWELKRNITETSVFSQASHRVCDDDFKNIIECHSEKITSQQKLACYFEFKHRVKKADCRMFLNRIGTILFSDYHLVFNFAVSCSGDIQKFKCGRLAGRLPGSETEEKVDLPSSQGRTIECLLEKVDHLDRKCGHEITRVLELQADDYHLDRPLFFACRADREKLCSHVNSGEGRVFKCLMNAQKDARISHECRDHLAKRMALRQKSYKVDYSFTGSCESDVKKLKCITNEEVMEANRKSGISGTAALSQVLLCLENAVKMKTYQVAPECLSEMFDIRRQLMSDFRISPEIVMHCKVPIERQCGNGVQRNGATLHCLMDIYKGKLGQPGTDEFPKCAEALQRLIKLADPGSDYRVDPVIGQACSAVIAGSCSTVPKQEGAVLSCLMNHLDSTEMTDQCSEKLMELQYILSRDFTLDVRLYRGCQQDAVRLCKANPQWAHPKTQRNHRALVFSCLYRQMQARERHLEDEEEREDEDDTGKGRSSVESANLLSKTCAAEVLRSVRERSKRVMLNPYVYDSCMSDLAKLCLQSAEGHQEIRCLQNNLNSLTSDCKEVVMTFTTEQERHPSLDRIMATSCQPMIQRFCSHEMQNDPGQIMPCLIRNKGHPEMNEKCRAGVEHHQIISLKDYHISHAFRRGCARDLKTFCNKVRSKNDAVNCLSEVIRNNTLLDKEVPLSPSCRQQVRFENLQRSQDIRLSPRLAKECKVDIRRHCSGVRKGKQIQCLRRLHWSDLEKRCQKVLFRRIQLESIDSRIDSRLQRVCKSMIKHYCTGKEKEAIDCLWKHIHDYDFDAKCRRVVYLRLETRAKDYRLDPLITHLCKHDIRKHCASALDPTNNMTGSMYRGRVTSCLKERYRKFDLSIGCKGHIRQLIVETNMNHHMDPILRRACEQDVQRVCATELEDSNGDKDGDGAVTECLKRSLSEVKIKSLECQKETLRLMEEGRADVHVDPVLYNSCINELRTICRNTPLGNGKQMACLLWAKDDREAGKGMSYQCRKQVKLRAEMWEMAAKLAPPDTLEGLASQITTSNAKNYFFAFIASVILVIFIFGLCCGRATKRVRIDVKNK